MGVSERFAEVCLLRRGESTANAQGLFTGVLATDILDRQGGT